MAQPHRYPWSAVHRHIIYVWWTEFAANVPYDVSRPKIEQIYNQIFPNMPMPGKRLLDEFTMRNCKTRAQQWKQQIIPSTRQQEYAAEAEIERAQARRDILDRASTLGIPITHSMPAGASTAATARPQMAMPGGVVTAAVFQQCQAAGDNTASMAAPQILVTSRNMTENALPEPEDNDCEGKASEVGEGGKGKNKGVLTQPGNGKGDNENQILCKQDEDKNEEIWPAEAFFSGEYIPDFARGSPNNDFNGQPEIIEDVVGQSEQNMSTRIIASEGMLLPGEDIQLQVQGLSTFMIQVDGHGDTQQEGEPEFTIPLEVLLDED